MEAATLDKIGGLNEAIAKLIASATNGNAVMVPAAAALTNTEQFGDAPRFHRHAFSTERLPDWLDYVARNASEDLTPAAYVKPDGKGAFSILDHGIPGRPEWGHHTAELKLREASAWIAAQAVSQGNKTQQHVIDWLEDWPVHITAHAHDGAAIDNRSAITALRRVKLEAKATVVKVEGNFSRQKSALESIDASGDTEALPAYFVVHSPLYIGTLEHEIVMRLGVREDSGSPVLALRVVGREVLQERTANWLEVEIYEKLRDAKVSVYVGEIKACK